MKNFFFLLFITLTIYAQVVQHKQVNLDLTKNDIFISLKNSKIKNSANMYVQMKEIITSTIDVDLKNIEPFLGVGLKLYYDGADNNVDVYARALSSNNEVLSDWKKYERFDAEQPVEGEFKSDLLFLPKETSKIQLRIVIKDLTKKIILKNAEIFYDSPGKTPEEEIQRNIEESKVMLPSFKLSKGKLVSSYPRPNYVARSSWGASLGLTNTNSSRTTTTVTHLVLHNSASDTYASDYAAVVRAYWDWHVNGNGWSDIGYNWLVDPNGVVYQGRAWYSSAYENVVGAHNSGYNTYCLGLNIIGNYEVYQPTQASLNKMAQVMAFLCDKFNLDPTATTYFAAMGVNKPVITGHRDSGGGTDCPGQYLIAKYSWFRTTVNTLLNGGSTSSGVVLSSPSNSSKHVSIQPQFSWQSYSGASSYQLQISTNSTFSTTVVNQSGISGTSYTLSSAQKLNYGLLYYWRVKADNSSEWSEVWSFTTSGMLPLVEKKSGNNSLPSWFGGSSTDNTERGIAYTSNEILVVSRKGSTGIRRLNYNDLSDIGTMDISGVSGGTYILNDIETTWDGKILACNLTTSSSSNFKIYKWDGVTGTPSVYIDYANTSGLRLGDNFTVYGSLSSNAAIYVPAGNSNKVLKWSISGGVLNPTPTVITLTLPSGVAQLNSPVSVAPYGYGNEDFYVNAPNINPTLYGQDGTNKGSISGGVIPQASTTIKTFVVGGSRYLMAFLSNNTAGDPNGQNMIIVDVTDGPTNVNENDIYGKSIRLGDVSNSNMTGDLCYRALNGQYIVYVLSTNNGIGAYKCMIAPLPVELSSEGLQYRLEGEKVKLYWKTKSEQNNDRFEIERYGLTGWVKIGEIKGSGNSNVEREYVYEDKLNNKVGIVKYRLKQVDNDGNYKYLTEVEVEIGKVKNYIMLENYPNPFNPTTKIRYYIGESGEVRLNVYNMLGEKVKELYNGYQEKGEYVIDFSGNNLPSGVYMCRIESNGKSKAIKMLLNK